MKSTARSAAARTSFSTGTLYMYIGHATALAMQQVIAEDKLLDNVKAHSEQMRATLRSRFASHPSIGDVRRRSLFVGVELVRDRDSKSPFDPALRLHAIIKNEAMKRGLMVYPMGGTIDGWQKRRSCVAGAAVHLHGRADRHDRRSSRRCNRRRARRHRRTLNHANLDANMSKRLPDFDIATATDEQKAVVCRIFSTARAAT